MWDLELPAVPAKEPVMVYDTLFDEKTVFICKRWVRLTTNRPAVDLQIFETRPRQVKHRLVIVGVTTLRPIAVRREDRNDPAHNGVGCDHIEDIQRFHGGRRERKEVIA